MVDVPSLAYLNGIAYPYSPNSVDWNYILNKVSFNTVGGRVTQILSIRIGTITWEGDAGSRQALFDLYTSFKNTQDYQINNELSSPLNFPAPIGSNLNIPQIPLSVWARSMELGWDYQSVTYPYRMQFEVDEGFGDITQSLTTTEIDNLVKNIGWSNGTNSVGSQTSDYSGVGNNSLLKVNTSISNALSTMNNPPISVPTTPVSWTNNPSTQTTTFTNSSTTTSGNQNANQQSIHSAQRTNE